MSKSLRLSEKWFHRGLWLVAFIFAWFLVGLGSTVVGDLPRVEQRHQLEDFMDPEQRTAVNAQILGARQASKVAQDGLEQAQLGLQAAQADNRAARETFSNWLATRRVTERAEQDQALLERTRELDVLRKAEREAQGAVEAQQQAALNARQAQSRGESELREMEEAASANLREAQRAQELRVFLYRLALTLPLLVAAGWLFATKRKSTYWPFVWGFIFFALFAFFVELVPYLPSYGGYVRYLVGIVLTVVGGRYAIQALQRYLERQKQAEALPDTQRRKDMNYDLALTRLSKNVCPGCERTVDLKDGKTDFCPHCGLCLFDQCAHCKARKSAFALFCFSCGASARREDAPAPETLQVNEAVKAVEEGDAPDVAGVPV
ncbi:serine endopeptidase [Hydrogenophaga crassostreae]|uniref:Serine endopeptidase n=1 Tax=Hydrogenophaga crassostreae TaxID=1763535 RepID=A0A1D8P0G0_9BURK|nr:serine endopeptidase [Hydrogenophaga crassostreae]AOW14842.1 serine endopeptidase [Hydrogenophaga crassostreae]